MPGLPGLVPSYLRTPKALLVEGKDECNFFSALLKRLAITDVTPREVRGCTNLRPGLEAFLNDPGFKNVTAYGVVLDADKDVQATFDSVCTTLRTLGQPHPGRAGTHVSMPNIRIGVFIMPGDDSAGMLEDLCLRSVKTHPFMSCVDRYFDCIRDTSAKHLQPTGDAMYTYPSNEAKARAQAFLAAMPELVQSVGLGALKGYWDFDSPELDPLKKFLEFLR